MDRACVFGLPVLAERTDTALRVLVSLPHLGIADCAELVLDRPLGVPYAGVVLL